MINNLTLSLLSLISWHPLPAEIRTAEELAAKSQAASYKPSDPTLDYVGTKVRICSLIVNRQLRADEWITDKDVSTALHTQKDMRLIEVINDCSFFMPEAMQLRLIKEDLRETKKNKKQEPNEPWYHEQCSKAIGLPLQQTGYFTEAQFQHLLNTVKPQESAWPCYHLIAPYQYERWLGRQAVFLLKWTEKEPGFAPIRNKNNN